MGKNARLKMIKGPGAASPPPPAQKFVSTLHPDQYWKIRARMEQLQKYRAEATRLQQTVEAAVKTLQDEMTKVGLDPALTYTFDDNALTFSR